MNVFILGVLLFISSPDSGTEWQKFKIFQLFLTYIETIDEDELYRELTETIIAFRKQQCER